MIRRTLPALLVLGLAALVTPSTASAASPKLPSPEKMLQRETSGKQWKLNYTGEDFAWQTAYSMNDFLNAYDSTHDQAYLDAAVKFYDAILAKMQIGPDGYKGFIGPFEYNNKFWCDVHVGDAILFDGILAFSNKVMDDPALKQKYADKAMEYVNRAKKDFFEKWDSRGTYHPDGPYGFYVAWDKYGQPGQLIDWKVEPACAADSNLSLPFNKDLDCAAVALRIWRISGEEKYKHKAEQLFGYMKSRMQNYNGAYHWNYWEPAGQWDLATTPENLQKGSANIGADTGGPDVAKTTMRHWTGVHPRRNYQANEMIHIVLAYNAGLVFTQADIEGMIQTNLKVMWNGDEKNPLWGNSNLDLLKDVGNPKFYFKVPNKEVSAGEPWKPLVQFDAQIRKLSGEQDGPAGPPPSFDRKHAKTDVKIPPVYAQFPLGNVRTIQMACVLPSIFAQGQTTAIDCKLIENGELEIALYSPDGKSKIATLQKWQALGGSDGREGINYILWNGNLPDHKTAAPGHYRIRWTIANDGYREFPITIQPKK